MDFYDVVVNSFRLESDQGMLWGLGYYKYFKLALFLFINFMPLLLAPTVLRWVLTVMRGIMVLISSYLPSPGQWSMVMKTTIVQAGGQRWNLPQASLQRYLKLTLWVAFWWFLGIGFLNIFPLFDYCSGWLWPLEGPRQWTLNFPRHKLEGGSQLDSDTWHINKHSHFDSLFLRITVLRFKFGQLF